MLKKLHLILVTAVLVSALIGCGTTPGGAEGSGTAQTVTILAFNDFHGALDESGSETGNPGGAKLVGKIKALKAENPESTLVLAAGDNYQGSALANLNYGRPVSDLCRLMGVQYSAVGNHEFDWVKGPSQFYFEDWEKDGNFKFLAANIVDRKTGKLADFALPYAITVINGKKIGLIGLITLETPSLVIAANISGLDFTDPSEAAKKYYDFLKKKEKCDAVIALTHLPSSMQDDTISGEAADLARALPELDGIISGHSHLVVLGRVNGVPIVQASNNGRYISRLDLQFDRKGKLLAVEPSLVNISDASGKASAPVDQEALAIINTYKTELAPLMAQVVGYNDTALHTKPEVAEWMCKVLYDYLLRVEGKPFIVTQNDGGVRSGGIPLPPGDITMNYMYGLMPFDNSIVVMEVTGKELIAIIERPREELVSALDYYGLRQENGQYRLIYDNSPIDPNKTYNLMCNDFMYTGGDRFDFSAGKNARYLGIPLRDALIEETLFRSGKRQSLAPESQYPFNLITLVMMNGPSKTSVFRTSP
ncbi:MAG: 5'-nucleotidase C-terminal domain-containing protein [Spirochaetaceae bacterium]|jgi:2',3'-cyclic-nucleotide 2'-phosphodiesterase (5'-nucleotidase family)|nr:5'-nucleotidase C-terminal domain-containing protein [Spirochaetaceae bacterium]